jgi:hypothetical protein
MPLFRIRNLSKYVPLYDKVEKMLQIFFERLEAIDDGIGGIVLARGMTRPRSVMSRP